MEIRVMTSNSELRQELQARGLMAEGGAGDTKITWNPKNKDEVDAARKMFDELKKKGFSFFKVARGKGGERIDSFDEMLGKINARLGEKAVATPRLAGGSAPS